MREYQVIIVGGGIAGAATAYFLSRRGVTDILLVEREQTTGYHSSGRAAGVVFELELDRVTQRLIAEGAAFLRAPDGPLAGEQFVDATGVMQLLHGEELPEIEAAAVWMREHGTRIEIIDRDAYLALVPGLSDLGHPAAAFMPDCGRLDAVGLLRAYLRHAEAAGVQVACGAGVDEVLVDGGRCRGAVIDGERTGCRVLVNAAGAWAGGLAALAGATAIPMAPLRRTIAVLDPPDGTAAAVRAPMVELDGFYFAPESGGLMTSPMDQERVEPCDARPSPERIADCRSRLARAVPAWSDAPVRSARAGLRSFAPDRRLVVGHDPALPGFFWVAGLGGWGIESSPCYGRLAADLICEGATAWPHAAAIAPDRFRSE